MNLYMNEVYHARSSSTNSTHRCLKSNAFNRFDVLGVHFSAANLQESTSAIDQLIEQREKSYVSVCPVSTIMECVDNEKIRSIVNAAHLVTTDGMPSVWIGKSRGHKNVGRVYGPDLLLSLCSLSNTKEYKHYFYGSTDDVLKKLISNLKDKFPGLKIAGTYSPPYRDLASEEDQKIVQKINEASPDIIWVGLGSPKQDLWIYEHRNKLDASVLIAVGAAFDFIAQTKPQAPLWMQRSGFEWLFRLISEPQRLWRRYLFGNTRFIYLYCLSQLKKAFR